MSAKSVLTQAALEGLFSGAAMYLATPLLVDQSVVGVETSLGVMSPAMASALAVGGAVAAVDMLQLLIPDKMEDVRKTAGGYGRPLASAAGAVALAYFLMGGSLDGWSMYLKFALGAGACALIGDKAEDLVKDTKVLNY